MNTSAAKTCTKATVESFTDSDSDAASRLIIKNLPSRITAERLRNICNELGLVTDCQLKYAQNGLFRKFAFVGFRTVDEADKAKTYLNNTFIDSSKIQVEFCKRLNVNEPDRKNHQTFGVKDDDVDALSNYPEVKLENLPRNVKKKSLLQFFLPLKPLKIEISPDKFSVVVKLKKKSDVKILLKFDGRFFGGNKLAASIVDKSKSDAGASSNVYEKSIGEQKSIKQQTDIIIETGRLFVRNIAYVCTLNDVESAFEKFGPLADVKLPLDANTKQHKGYAIVSFVMPEHALKAFTEMDGIVFNGRMLHIVPGEESKDTPAMSKFDKSSKVTSSSYKSKKDDELKSKATSSHNWNTLFLGANAVADVLVDKFSTEKSELLNASSKTSLGIRMALGETQIVRETREFLMQNGVCLESFSDKGQITKRSKTVIIVKNLPAKTAADEMRALFAKFGSLGRVILPSSGVSALVEFLDEQNARTAFKQLAYKRFKTSPLFLEWAPSEVFAAGAISLGDNLPKSTSDIEEDSKQDETPSSKIDEALTVDNNEPAATIFVKNLNFETTDEALKEHFSKIGPLVYATVSKKKAVGRHEGKEGGFLSMGYGFVQYKRKIDAVLALKELQKRNLDGFALELKLSERQSATDVLLTRRKEATKAGDEVNESDTKLLVRNIPFQASRREIEDIFKTFGELRNVRLPKKAGSVNNHRGFGFVDFTNKSDAVKAFEALSHSTHLYGRRLVLSWAAEEESLDDLRKRITDYAGGGKTLKKQKLMLEDLDKNY